ncbi:30S ribosomal protein S20 [Candidatus Berkelbacteria bacterium]|nr:30S ribosomal protein S20 [Candidatus Berkelbacteria bacterium]
MPNTKSAKKALRAARRKRAGNLRYQLSIKQLVKKAKTGKFDAGVLAAALDKAAKVGVIHRNKAARLKSRLMKKR